MAFESPDLVPGRDDKDSPVSPEAGVPDSLSRIQENIRLLAETRKNENLPVSQLEENIARLREYMALVLKEEKRLRIERSRLTSGRDKLRAGVLEKRKARVSKEEIVSKKRLELNEVKRALYENTTDEVVRLERRAEDLRIDVDTLEESLRIHRREREKAFKDLTRAQEDLQDELTEALLWRIQSLGLNDTDDEGGRKGLAGVLAEFLGRLLVLEKEGAQASWILEAKTPEKMENPGIDTEGIG